MDDSDDPVIRIIPIRYSNTLGSRIHLHQYPLLSRPLQVPPSAQANGERITARIKPEARRLEVHVPADTRVDVWNKDRERELGAARVEDDKEKNQAEKSTQGEDEPKLKDVRLQSEEIPQHGVYMLGVMHGGELHLHRINQTHQFRTSLTYLDFLSRKKRSGRGGDSDSDSDDGPPPDPDEVSPVTSSSPKKEKKTPREVKEVQLSARKSDEKTGMTQGGLSNIRRDMLLAIRAEEDEEWRGLEYNDTMESEIALEGLYSKNNDVLTCKTDATAFLKDIPGL